MKSTLLILCCLLGTMSLVWAQDSTKFDYGGTNILIDDLDAGDENVPAKTIEQTTKTVATPATEQPLSGKPVMLEPTPARTATRTVFSEPTAFPDLEMPSLYSEAMPSIDVIKRHKLIAPIKANYPLNAGKEPSYDDNTYQARLSALQTAIPMEYNEMVGNFINMYIQQQRGQVKQMLARTDMYFPTIGAALDRYELPYELKYIPVMLSALLPGAKSENGNAGLWQLSYKTATLYGLESNDLIDERRDPLLSSEAAARYLKVLYKKYRNWHLAIAAFCAGEGVVNKAIGKSHRYNYWDIAAFMPLEAQAYVPLFTAAAYVMNYYPEHNLYKTDPSYTYYLTDTLRIKRQIDIKSIAGHLNLPYEDLKFLNPALKTDMVPPSIKGYPFVVPISKVGALASYIETLKAGSQDRVVGQTSAILPLPPDHPLSKKIDEYGNVIGEYKPTTSTIDNVPTQASTATISADSVILKYKVLPDEELEYIAISMNTSKENIMDWNRLSSDQILTGQLLDIRVAKTDEKALTEVIKSRYHVKDGKTITESTPTKTKSKPNEPKTVVYTVKEGDTLSSIADKYNAKIESIMKYNGLKSNTLKVGQKISIPVK
ncbi:MAG: LysM peptidoglycan-binding domain-containing protein [Chitinophagales bacterium]|nr:LysM peptidoglycan-binding domain-containing protein [Chitinophagales bacterium]